MRRSDLEPLIEPLYHDLPYHNFSHALQVTDSCEELMERCDRHGISYDAGVVFAAGLGHDAGYHEVEREKEQHSAKIIADLLAERLGWSPKRISEVEHAIIATHYAVMPRTVEAKIVAAADLRELMGDYKQFKQNTLLLYEEIRLSNPNADFGLFLGNAYNLMENYLNRNIRITEVEEDDHFHRRVRLNLDRLFQDYRVGKLASMHKH